MSEDIPETDDAADDIDLDFLDLFGRDADTVVREGAAADAAEAERAITALLRVLRFANLALVGMPKPRITAEIAELLPEAIAEAAAWSDAISSKGWQALAARLDAAAIEIDRPTLRSLADAVRLSSMTVADVDAHPGDALRVIAALDAAMSDANAHRGWGQKSADVIDGRWLAGLEHLQIGWTRLASGDRSGYVSRKGGARKQAYALGKHGTNFIREREQAAQAARHGAATKASEAKAAGQDTAVLAIVPDDHVLVCPPIDTKSNNKVKDACKGHEHAIGQALPLVLMPDIAKVRRQLAYEYPYAVAAIDTLLAPLVGRRTVRVPPTVLVGPPGAGKSRLVRRLADLLGIGLWRSDGARTDGSTIGGTDRRWYTAEPCHPFLAVSRARIGNHAFLVDEIEKAGTRSDYGRLWDALLGFLERERARCYPDPCLQVDLSHVSIIATANSLLPLPAPLLDRLRVIELPEPRACDLDALVAPLSRDLLAEQQLDTRWAEPLGADDLALLAAKWRGGSVRRLRAYLGVLLRACDRVRPLR